MKLCYIAPPCPIYTRGWLDYFAGHGHEVHLITDGPVAWDGIISHQLNLGIPEGIILLWRRLRELNKLIRKINPDILHAHYVTAYGYWGALSGFSPFLLTLWGSDIFLVPRGNDNHLLTKFSLARADLLTGNSEAILKAAAAIYDKSCLKAERISMGVKLDDFIPAVKSGVAARLPPGDNPVVLSNRRFDPVYNIDVIIETIPVVLRQFPKATFVFTDQGSLREKLEKRVDALKLSDSVIFTGYLSKEDYLRYLTAADIVISVPSSDSSPGSVLQAMACGKAVIISDVAGPKELIRDGWNGFVVPIRNTEILAEKIIMLLRNQELAKEFGERSYEFVKEREDYRRHMDRMENLYEELGSPIRGN